MSTRAVTDEQLQGIADAIKLKSGDDTPMSVADMALRIGLIEGGLPAGLKVDFGQFVLDASTSVGDYLIHHNLGKIPKLVVGWLCEQPEAFFTSGEIGGVYVDSGGVFNSQNDASAYMTVVYHSNTTGGISRINMNNTQMQYTLPYLTDTTLIIPAYNSNGKYYANKQYKWLCATWDD